jgi:hypothetical protein
MMTRGFMLAALLALAGSAPPADAASVLNTGTFDTALIPFPGLPSSLTGAFTFTFDESMVPASWLARTFWGSLAAAILVGGGAGAVGLAATGRPPGRMIP